MWMKHQDLPDNEPAEVTEDAFNTVWRHRGWQECDPPAEPEPDRPQPAVIDPRDDQPAADAAATNEE